MIAQSAALDIGDLVRFGAKPVEHRLEVMRLAKPALEFVARLPLEVITSLVVYYVDRNALSFSNAAIWFRGVREDLATRSVTKPLDPELDVVKLVDEMLADVAKIRPETQALIERLDQRRSRRTRLADALRSVDAACAQMQVEAEAFKFKLLEHEATASAGCSVALRGYFDARDPLVVQLIDRGRAMTQAIERLDSDDLSDIDPAVLAAARRAIERNDASLDEAGIARVP